MSDAQRIRLFRVEGQISAKPYPPSIAPVVEYLAHLCRVDPIEFYEESLATERDWNESGMTPDQVYAEIAALDGVTPAAAESWIAQLPEAAFIWAQTGRH